MGTRALRVVRFWSLVIQWAVRRWVREAGWRCVLAVSVLCVVTFGVVRGREDSVEKRVGIDLA